MRGVGRPRGSTKKNIHGPKTTQTGKFIHAALRRQHTKSKFKLRKSK